MGGAGQPGPDIGLWSRVLHPSMLDTGRSGTTPSRRRHLKGTGRCWPVQQKNQFITMYTNLKFTRLCVTCMKFQRCPIKRMYNICYCRWVSERSLLFLSRAMRSFGDWKRSLPLWLAALTAAATCTIPISWLGIYTSGEREHNAR